MTTKELAKILRLSQRATSERCKRLQLPKVYEGRHWKYYLTQEQVEMVSKLEPKNKKEILEVIEFIRIETTYYIYPSKLNYLEV